MNRYGRMAYDHSRQHRPTAFASLSDPTAYFTRMGEEVATQITQLRDELLGPPQPDETLEGYRHRSYQAQRQAEELVLTETVWFPAEETATPAEDDEILSYRAQLASMSRALAAADREWTDTPVEGPTTP